MSEYYTPTENEIVCNLEFEYLRNDVWSEDIITFLSEAASVWKDHDSERHPVRVKYLDREDIESFGFELFDTTKKDEIYFRASDNLMTEQEIRLWVSKEFGYIEINDIKEKTGCEGLFRGKIKNKSELKKVLKSIGYE